MRPSLLASTFTLLLLSTAPFAWADDATHALEESLRLLSAPVQGCIDPQKGPLRATPLSEPEICRDPMKAVCENSPPPTIQLSESEIRARVNQALNKEDRKNTNFYGQFAQEINLIITKLRSGEPVDPKQLTGALSTYSRILNKTQDEIMTQFLKFGVTRDSLEEKFKEVQLAVVARIEQNSAFKTSDSKNPFPQERLSAIVKKIRLITPRSFRTSQQAESQLSQLATYFDVCGMDGLSSQAVYLIDERELILCPGFLLETLKGGSLDPVSLVFGHELGHAADALASDPKSPVQLPLLDRYKGFFSCIDRNYSSELKSFASAKKYVTETGFPALKTYLAQLESANPRNNEEIVRIKRSIQVITGYVATLPTAEQDFNAMFPPSPTPAQSHAGELTADLMATESAAQLLLRVEHSNRAASLAKQLRHNCDNDPTLYRLKVIYGNPVDDGTHPPGKFRIENTLRSPKIREALGCAKKSIPGQPWCSMESR